LAWAEEQQTKSFVGIPNVCLCIPHFGSVSLEWVETTYSPLRFIPQPDFVKTNRLSRGILNLDTERNFLVKSALDDKTVTHILFLDTDCIAEGDPNQYLRNLLSINIPIVSGLYRAKKSKGEYPYCMFMKNPQTKTGRWEWTDGFAPILKWTGNFIEADVVGLGFTLVKREVFEKVPYPWFIWDSEPCVTEGQKLFLGQTINELKSSDQVINGKGELAAVSHCYERPYKGEVIKILPKCLRIPITVTPKHRILTLKNVKSVKLNLRKKTDVETYRKKGRTCWLDFNKAEETWVQAQNMRKGDYVAIPIIKHNGKKIIELRKNTSFHRKSDGRLYNKRFQGQGIPMKLEISEELGELLGYYVAEGSTEPKRRRVRFSFGTSLSEFALLTRVQFLLEKIFGISSVITKGKRAMQVLVRNSSFSQLMSSWFESPARNKKIPSWLLMGTDNLIRGFIKGIWKGDGYATYTGNKSRCFGINITSEQVALSIFAMLLRFGFKPILNKNHQHQNAYGAGNPIYSVKITQDIQKMAKIVQMPIMRSNKKRQVEHSFFYKEKLWVKVDEVTPSEYEGKIFDLSILDGGSYILGGIIVHNSEDFRFCILAAEHGFKTKVFTECKFSHQGILKVKSEGAIHTLDV